MSLFPPDIIEQGLAGLGENVQSPRPADWQGALIADVFQWFRTTPGANPVPDAAALNYYAEAGYDQFMKDVAAVRAQNPTVAAQIDKARVDAGLDRVTTPPPPPPAPVVVRPPVVQPPVVRPVFTGPIYAADAGTANATLIGYLSDDPAQAEFRVAPGARVPSNFVLVSALPTVTPPPVKVTNPQVDYMFDEAGNVICEKVRPVYSRKLPLPTIDHDAIGFLYGQGPTDIPWQCPFNLKKGDAIPLNWQEDFEATTQPVVVRPVTPVAPTGGAGGVGTLILAAAAAYLLGS